MASQLLLSPPLSDLAPVHALRQNSQPIMLRQVVIIVLLCVYEVESGADRFEQLDELLLHHTDDHDEIHRVAVETQVKYYEPAQRSLHTRSPRTLNGLYDFCLDESRVGFGEKWHSRDLQTGCQANNYYRMPVPAAFNEITSNKTVRNYIGWLWYQTTVDYLPAPASGGSNLYVQFESINYLAIVYVQNLHPSGTGQREDAQLVGAHVGGQLPFLVELPPTIKESSSAFRLTIAVSNNLTSETIPSGRLLDLSDQVGRPYKKFQPDFDFFHFAGLMGAVNLFQLPQMYIREVAQIPGGGDCTASGPCAEFIIYPSLSAEQSGQDNEVSPPPVCLYNFELWLGREHRLVNERAVANNCEPASFSVQLNDSQLFWAPANGRSEYFAPKLSAKITLATTSSSSQDRYELKRVAFRRHSKSQQQQQQQQQQLQGFGLHQEQEFAGRSVSDASIMKDIYLLKKWGANLVRTSHYPYSVEFLDACQENGIQVIGECSAVGLSKFDSRTKLMLHKQLMKEMVKRDQNNAAIVGWSVANEPESQHKEARPYFAELLHYCVSDLFNYTRRSDRFLTAAIAQSHETDKIGHLLDAIMINRYFGWYDYTGVLEAIARPLLASVRGWAHKYPGVGLLISEFGADTLAGMHSLHEEIFSEEFQASLVVEHERVFDRLFGERNSSSSAAPNFMGSLVWNFADFSTDVSLLRAGGNRKGIFTKDRRPKLAAHELRKIYLARLQATTPVR